MDLNRRQVVHQKHGSGTVTGLKGSVLRVFFDQFGSHCFRYPDAFASELKAADPEVQAFVERELNEE